MVAWMLNFEVKHKKTLAHIFGKLDFLLYKSMDEFSAGQGTAAIMTPLINKVSCITLAAFLYLLDVIVQ